MTKKKRGNPNLVKGGPALNPHGRPKGSVNVRTQLQNELIDSFAGEMKKDFKDVLKAVIREAKNGDMSAAKILMDRAIPVRKSVEHLGVQDGMAGITINISPLAEGVNPMKLVTDDEDGPVEAEYTEVTEEAVNE